MVRRKSRNGSIKFANLKPFPGHFYFPRWFGFVMTRMVCCPLFILQPSEISMDCFSRCTFCWFFPLEKFINGTMRISSLPWFLHFSLLPQFGLKKSMRDLIGKIKSSGAVNLICSTTKFVTEKLTANNIHSKKFTFSIFHL